MAMPTMNRAFLVVLTEHWTAYHEFKSLPWWRRRVIRDVVKGVDALCPVKVKTWGGRCKRRCRR